MKKFILIIFILFISCNFVKADCINTAYKNYEVMVSNKNGAVIYKESEKGYEKTNQIIPYKTKLYVSSDAQKLNDDYILSVYSEDQKYNGFIKASDVKNVKEFEDKKLKLKKTNYYTYEDTEVRSGPGVLYDIVGVIKADTNVYSNENFVDNDGNLSASEKIGAWVYISDGKIGGYIYYDTCYGTLPIKVGKLVQNNSNNYYYIGKDDYGIGLKRYDKVNIKYVVQDYAHHQSYYIEYNNKNALIHEELIVESFEHQLIFTSFDSNYIILNYVTDITGNFIGYDKSLNKSEHLKIGQKYTTKYYNHISDGYDNYYIEIDGKMYRIIYSKNVPKNDLIVYDENKIYNIEYKGKKIDTYKVLNSYDENVYYNSEYGIINPDNEKSEEETVTKTNSKQYITWFLIGGTLLVLGGIIIFIVNRKKLNGN